MTSTRDHRSSRSKVKLPGEIAAIEDRARQAAHRECQEAKGYKYPAMQPPSQASRLLDLPAEVRKRILVLASQDDDVKDLARAMPSAIAVTCKQLFAESMQIHIEESRWEIPLRTNASRICEAGSSRRHGMRMGNLTPMPLVNNSPTVRAGTIFLSKATSAWLHLLRPEDIRIRSITFDVCDDQSRSAYLIYQVRLRYDSSSVPMTLDVVEHPFFGQHPWLEPGVRAAVRQLRHAMAEIEGRSCFRGFSLEELGTIARSFYLKHEAVQTKTE